MGRFNKPKPKSAVPNTTNIHGAAAYKETPYVELTNRVLTTLELKNSYYESIGDNLAKIADIIEKHSDDHKFMEYAIKLTVYARKVIGLRSISHFLTAVIALLSSGTGHARKVVYNSVRRPDDMLEIASIMMALKEVNKLGQIGNGAKRAFAQILENSVETIDDYIPGRFGFTKEQLAKWRKPGSEISLVDIVRVSNLKKVKNPTTNRSHYANPVIEKLMRDEIIAESMQVKLSTEGNTENTWRDLLFGNKLGYQALLFNLRSILKTGNEELIDKACSNLVDAEAIKRSLTFPHQFITAYDAIETSALAHKHKVLAALEKAVDISVSNVPAFEEPTLIALDTSSSMRGNGFSGYMSNGKAPYEYSSILGAALHKNNPSTTDVMLFDSTARYLKVAPGDSAISMSKALKNMTRGGATYMHKIFENTNKAYHRIIILTDNESYGRREDQPALDAYAKSIGFQPIVHVLRLSDQSGTLTLNPNKVYQISGFSDKVFDIMAVLEKSPASMIDHIRNSVYLR